jgi:hypothetical protein
MGKYLDLAEQVTTTREEPQGSPLLAKYPPDELGEPCPACGSKEKWIWLDGRQLCRPCLIRGDRLAVTTGPILEDESRDHHGEKEPHARSL